MGAANRRYLEFLSSLDDDTAGRQRLEKLSQRVRKDDRTYRGINFFDPEERALFLTLARGELNLRGFQVRDLRALLPDRTGPQLSRHLKRLRMHGLLKKVRGTYKYYLTRLGRRVTAAAMKLREDTLIPALAA